MQRTNASTPPYSLKMYALTCAAFVAALVTGVMLISVGHISAGEAAAVLTACAVILGGPAARRATYS